MPDTMRNIEPHFTVLYPFAPYEQLPEVAPRLAQVLAGCPPRRLSIRGFAVFQESGVLYLRLADPERVLSLYRAITPHFAEYLGLWGAGRQTITSPLT